VLHRCYAETESRDILEPIVKKKRKEPLELTLFKFAEMHYRAGGILLQKVTKDPDSTFPATVLVIFGFELYLKCLIAIEGKKPPRIHDLRDLFFQLSKESQVEIRRAYKERAKTDPFFKRMKQFYEEKGFPVDHSFDSVLKSCASAFVHFRYLWEYEGGGKWHASALLECVRQRITKLRSEGAPARHLP